ncbi:MAG TPA: monovalent cation/H+ antiporter complex subunit F [Gammaproteobacteria bacterium]|nr:monovalent cation/H+ antiporter complex subunit F [Gammaproteobacteria bacterium]
MNDSGLVNSLTGSAITICVLALLVTLMLGLVRALQGPSLEDRLAAVLLLGTGGVAFLLLLAVLWSAPALIDVALLLALLAAVVAAAMTRQEGRSD